MKFYKILISLAHILSICTQILSRSISCSTTNVYTSCIISGLQLTKEDSKFTPTITDPEAVTKFVLRYSKIPIITRTICDTFPNLLSMEMEGNGIEEVDEDAFQNCPKLKSLDLDKNRIVNLKNNTFANLTSLETMYFLGANIPFIQVGLFDDMKNLKSLLMRKSGIIELPSEAFRNLESLEVLSIYSNELLELDIENIVKYSRKLHTIRLNDNYFKCTRLQDILSVLKRNSITIDVNYEIRSRSQYPEQVDRIYCMTDVQWSTKVMEASLHFPASKFLEHYPLGKKILDTNDEIELLKASFGYMNETIGETLEAQRDSFQLVIDSFKTSIQGEIKSINDTVNKQDEILENIKNATAPMKAAIAETKTLRHSLDEKVEYLSSLITDVKETVDQMIEKQQEEQVNFQARTGEKEPAHVTGLWVITSLYLVVSLIVLAVYISKHYRNSRGVYNAYNVKYKDGLVVPEDGDL